MRRGRSCWTGAPGSFPGACQDRGGVGGSRLPTLYNEVAQSQDFAALLLNGVKSVWFIYIYKYIYIYIKIYIFFL